MAVNADTWVDLGGGASLTWSGDLIELAVPRLFAGRRIPLAPSATAVSTPGVDDLDDEEARAAMPPPRVVPLARGWSWNMVLILAERVEVPRVRLRARLSMTSRLLRGGNFGVDGFFVDYPDPERACQIAVSWGIHQTAAPVEWLAAQRGWRRPADSQC